MKSLLFIYLLIAVNLIHAQEKWNIDRSKTSKPPVGNYSLLPLGTNNWENPNKTSRTLNTNSESLIIYPNTRVLPNSNQQDEVILVRHPLNPLIMFGSANTTVGGSQFGIASYATTDGGLSWFGIDIIPTFGGSPSDPGPTVDKNGVFIMTTLNPGMAASYSTNNGVSWSSVVNITTQSSDKNFAASDDVPASAYYGRSYCVWSDFSATNPPIAISYTTNSSVSWSPLSVINTPPSGHYSQGCDITTGPNGEVYVCWAAPVSSGSFTEDFAGFAKSVNGGVNWTVNENIYDMNGIRSSSYNGWGVRVNSFPRIAVDKSGGSRNGWVYIVASDVNLAPAGSDADVILHRSSDGGVTWSAGIRVNQDALNNGKVQFFPAINVDDAGGVNIVYYDNRNYPSVGDSCQTYMSRSVDGGNTWTDILVSDHSWKVKGESGLGNYMGDYIGVTSGLGKIWPFWFDDKSGSMQAWTSGVIVQSSPLNAFNLNSPAANYRIQTLPNNTTNYIFNWDTSTVSATYKWIFGSPTTSPRKITLTPSGNSLTVTGGQLDNLLAGLGVAQGDSLVGQWDIWAYRNNATNDSLKATNGPRAITLKRGKPALTAFNLSAPANNSTVLTLISNTTVPVNINWTKSGEAVKYKWMYAQPNFSSTANIKFSVQSGNTGYDSSITLRNSQLDSMLAGIGVGAGDSSVGQWRVYGYSVLDSQASAQTYNLTLRRGIAPTITTTVDSIIVNLPLINQQTTRTFNIGNAGQFPLNWVISESSSAGDNTEVNNSAEIAAKLNAQYGNQPKGAPDMYHGEEQTDGMGGPDGFGYTWIDSDEPGGPAFNWVEISTTGTQITTWSGTIDDGYAVVPLPFSFPFYGGNYSQIKICTNGWQSFDVASTSAQYLNSAIPSTAVPNLALYPFWDDINITTAGAIYYYNDVANNRFIIEYKGVPHYTSLELYTFQTIIYNDGRIYYQYLSMDPVLVNSCTIGTEDAAGTTALQVVYNSAYLHNNLAIKIEKGLGWVDENPTSGIINPAGSQLVTVTFNSTGLLQNSTYNGNLNIGSNDPTRPSKTIKIKLNVGPVGIQSNSSLLGIPTSFELKQNYPNPFNPSTKISYALPKEGIVSLKIYDVLGKEVATLVNENKLAGYYEVDFNASAFASGIYFYKIEAGSPGEAGNFAETRRMILVK
jgi:hypothetical protein